MKIDIFAHFAPPKYMEALKKIARPGFYLQPSMEATPAVSDVDERLRIIDRYGDCVQVLTLAGPPLDAVVPAKDAVELARLANDTMAETVARYPDRFVGAVATLPYNDMEAALAEVDRAILELGLRGVQIHSPCKGKALDDPEFAPLFERMARYNLPIWIHPKRERTAADYPGEANSRYWIWQIFGWPYETTVAMTRLVFSGVFQRHPDLKFITHHTGAMVPYFADRITGMYDYGEVCFQTRYLRPLTEPVINYFQRFYNDTALCGNTPALMCAHSFCGADHLLFATDMPHDSQGGDRHIRQTIAAIEAMDISDADKRKIFEDNARRIMRLPV